MEIFPRSISDSQESQICNISPGPLTCQKSFKTLTYCDQQRLLFRAISQSILNEQRLEFYSHILETGLHHISKADEHLPLPLVLGENVRLHLWC